ncbi:DNA ligase I [Trichophyton equinum CBS 127.97]|uniref:DNA ligase n=1 Tax=Trichophyton equinum (strain ATCC MYA-4606 / CBS 127.97) TaxID=559882 RepID=F2Q5Q5_TRIEC|nr:DNA ligase I [Trichophyton equinum CBS 127.97]
MAGALKKKRKVDSTGPPQNTRSIASYFGAGSKAKSQPIPRTEHDQLTDEQLARKLQTEWNKKSQDESGSSTPGHRATETLQEEKPRASDEVADASSSIEKGSLPDTPTLTPRKENKPRGILSLQSSSMAEDTISFSLPFDLSPLEFDPHEQKEILQAHWMRRAGKRPFEAKKKQSFTLRRPKPLTIRSVYDALMKIANSKGTGSQETKQRIVEKLLQDTRGAEESRYIVRTLVQHLRIGAVKTTILIALARAFLYSKPPAATFPIRSRAELMSLSKEELSSIYSQAEDTIKACYARHPNYNMIVPCLLENGVSAELLTKCGITLHVPLLPMLGSITRDLPQMLTRLHGRSFTCEYKYDGQRAQVHCDAAGKVSIFSRHLELMTDKYPDLVSLVPQIRSGAVSSFIMEGEVVAVNNETGELLPFQTLTNRAKKNVEIGSIKVNVCLFSFDLMYLNGQPLLNRTFRERRELLRSLFVEIPNRFTWVKSIDAFPSDSDAVLNFFNDALQVKCEGIMVKVLDDKPVDLPLQVEDTATALGDGELLPPEEDQQQEPTDTTEKQRGNRKRPLLSTYEPDKRLESWLKVKKDYSASSETLDLIPIAAWHGQGRKAKWWSPILLAVRNPETGSLEAVTKCMSGFTDKFYEANKEKYAEGSDNIISRPSYVEYCGEPEVWFQPQEVWEMAFADITLSPTYTAAIGLVSDERGLSLRFPRFLRVREDKSIDEASTSNYLAHLWDKQAERAKVAEPQAGD